MDADTDIYDRKCILIVEDNSMLAGLLGRILETFHIAYHIVTNGLEALELCRERRYDLILMGMMLRRKDGLRATREILRISDDMTLVPIIGVVGTVSEHSRADYLGAGLTDIIKMPVNAVNLFDMLNTYMAFEDDTVTNPRDVMLKLDEPGAEEIGVVNWEMLKVYRAILKDDFLPLLEDYIAVSPRQLVKIGNAVRVGDASQVQFLAHKFKSTSLVFGAENVSNLAAQLEIIGKSKVLKGADDLFRELHRQFDFARVALEKKATLLRISG